MNIKALHQILAEHFDRCEPGQGQFVYGDWFRPKHGDSLQYLLDTLGINPFVVGGNS